MSDKRQAIDFAQYAGAAAVLVIMLAGALALHSAVGMHVQIFRKQLLWYTIGIVLMLALSRVDYRAIAGSANIILIGVLVALVAVLWIGKTGGGSQRWLGIGGFRLQPSELAKLAVILWVALWSANHPRFGGARLLELAIPGGVLLLVAGLVLLQPDLGTAVAVLAAGFAVLLIAGIYFRVLLWLAGSGVVAAVLGWFFVLKQYQKNRIIGFLNPEADPLGIGYHTIQSKIAIGSGGVRGAGFGQGKQTQLQFLPEQHTDFISAVWAEEWGFFGVCAMLVAYGWLLTWVARTALEAKDSLGSMIAGGILVHLTLHVGMNLLMAVGWAPVVGIPLPWMSYGGSAILVNCMAIGIVLSIRLRRRMF